MYKEYNESMWFSGQVGQADLYTLAVQYKQESSNSGYNPGDQYY